MQSRVEQAVSRRRLCALGAGAVVLLAGCLGDPRGGQVRPADGASQQGGGAHRTGRLVARPRQVQPAEAVPTGVQPLDVGPGPSALLYVPTTYPARRPLKLVVTLHGAGGDARGGLAPVAGLADELGLLLLAPQSREATWDVLRGGFGPDVEHIDRALTRTFEGYDVDPGRVIVAGFSDGASYALSLGITNGDLFASVLAFSPGFSAPGPARGSPRIFMSHGIEDSVLPIDSTSRKLAPRLRRAGHDVHYVEFCGGHSVPPEIARAAVTWALG